VIRRINFTLKDALLVCLSVSPQERAVYEALRGEAFDPEQVAAWAHSVPGPKFALDIPEAPVAIGGFIPLTPGTFRSWFYATGRAWEPGIGVTECCREIVQDALTLAHRVETVTLAAQEKARAWYPRIGLTFESTLHGYGANGEAAVMYRALRDAEKL
jgi:hypothetical protein